MTPPYDAAPAPVAAGLSPSYQRTLPDHGSQSSSCPHGCTNAFGPYQMNAPIEIAIATAATDWPVRKYPTMAISPAPSMTNHIGRIVLETEDQYSSTGCLDSRAGTRGFSNNSATATSTNESAENP